MSDLILFSEQDPSIPRVCVKLKLDLTDDQKTAARNAALGVGFAPIVNVGKNRIEINVVVRDVVTKTLVVESPNVLDVSLVCIAARSPQASSGEPEYVIVSGSVQIKVNPNLVQELAKDLWPTANEKQFGKLDLLIVTASGLQIETELQSADKDRRRFHLIESISIAPKPDEKSRWVWRQIAWRDAGLASDAKHKNPEDRLNAVEKESVKRLGRISGTPPIAHVSRFDERSGADGAVFVQVRIKKDGTPEVRERITPGWALSIGGADWSPRTLVINGEPLAKADFVYTDGIDAFDEPPTDNNDKTITSFRWSWTEAVPVSTERVLPELIKLASEPRLVTTGEVLGAGANLPYLWQRAKLVTKDAAEPGVWFRYRLDPLAMRESYVSRQPDYDAGLSRPIRMVDLKRDSRIDPWRLDLSLLPILETQPMATRMWLKLTPAGSGNRRNVTLTMLNARIEAAAPKIHALQTGLNDPASLPNQADRFEGLHADTQILLANDRQLPSDNGSPLHALQAAFVDNTITTSALDGALDALVAYVPGPVAGMDLVPRVGSNLTPAMSTNPTDPPLIRNYESGLVAVHLKSNITLHPATEKSPGSVRVSDNNDLFLPAEEFVDALHPWSLVSVKQDEFALHELQPLHHNALLETFDWARSAPDRLDPESGVLPPLVDPDGTEDGARDFRRDEFQYSMRNAVRDRFANATAKRLALGSDDQTSVVNWLPNVTFKAQKTDQVDVTIIPQILRKKSEPNALEFIWENAPDSLKHKLQSLKLTRSPREFKVEGSTFKSDAHGLSKNTPIQLFQTGVFPSGVSVNTTYFVVEPDSNTFKLSTSVDGRALTVADGEGEWQSITDDWLSAWMRWNEGDEVGKAPTVHIDSNGKNGARQAKSSDIPLLEQRTPITAVAAGWLSGRMWVVFAVDAAQGNPKLFAWEPLALKSPQELQGITLKNGPVDFLEIDSRSDRLLLVIVQAKSFQFARFRIDGSASPSDDGLSIVSNPLPVEIPGKITAVRIAAQRLFLGTDENSNSTLFVYEIDDTQSATLIATSNAGKVQCLDLRLSPDSQEKTVTLAVASDDNKVRLYHLAVPIDAPQSSTAIEPTAILKLKDNGSNKGFRSVVIQPLNKTTGDHKTFAFVYAVVADDTGEPTKVVTWDFAPVDSDTELESLSIFSGFSPGEESILSLPNPVGTLKTDSILNDNSNPTGPFPAAQWMFAATKADGSGHSSLMLWHVESWGMTDSSDELPASWRPKITAPIRFGNHEGEVVSAVLVPGRNNDGLASASEARFGTWLVTGGVDGTVRVWDPESGQEKFRHTETSGNWLDALGVTRQKKQVDSVSGFWAEAIRVPKGDGKNHELVLMLSTIGGPFDLLQNSTSPLPETELRLLCHELPLVEAPSAPGGNAWMPAPWNPTSDLTNRRFRHGIFGFCGKGKIVPRILGLPIEAVQITKVVLDQSFSSVSAATPVNVDEIHFDAILSNPAEMPPDGKAVPIVDRDKSGITAAVLKITVDSNGKVSLNKDSKFDWQFPLTDQLPPDDQSVLPGRLARLAGEVSLKGNILTLTPDAGSEEMQLSRAEALGRLRRFIRVPKLVIDPTTNGMVRFREAQSDENKLEQLGNLLPHPSGDDPITATEIGTDTSGNSVALIGAQPAAGKKPGSLQLSDLNTGQRLVSYTDRLKTARLVVDHAIGGNANVQRLTAIGVAEDGTVRVRHLYELEKDSNGTTTKPIDAAMQEQSRFVLPSPAEDVQVFDDAEGSRWILTRCRDGSAWLTNSLDGAVQHDVSLPETAVTGIAFGPAMPSQEELKKDEFAAWRDFFGSIDPHLAPNTEKGTLRAVIAIGGADGSIAVRAVTERETKPLRSFSKLTAPIQSLSLAIDKKFVEATPNGRGPVRGLMLMACDGMNPFYLVEIISGKSLSPAGSGLETNAAHQGILIYNTDLRGVVRTEETGSVSKVLAWTKQTSQTSDFIPTVIDSPVPVANLHLSMAAPDGGFAVVNENGWHLYDFDSGSAKFMKTPANNPGVVLDIADANTESEKEKGYRIVAALTDDGVLDVWKRTPSNPTWAKIEFDLTANTKACIDAATFGRVMLPMVACRGISGQLGSFYAVDLGANEWAWPDALGHVDANAPIAVAGLGGVPHLAVARSGNVTVWNLATGHVVHRVGLTENVEALDLAEDLDHQWLLAKTTATNSWKLALLRSKGPEIRELLTTSGGPISHARLFAFGQGLHVVTVATENNGTLLTLQVIAPDAKGNAITHHCQIPNFNATSVQILDVGARDDTVWVLLRHSVVGGAVAVSVLAVPPVSVTTTSVVYTLVENSTAVPPSWGTFELERGLVEVWTIDESSSEIAKWSFDAQAGPTKTDTVKVGSLGISKLTSLSLVRHNGRKRLVAVAEDGLAIWDLADKRLLRTEKLSNPVERVSLVAVAAVVAADANAGCLRFWDQRSGRLRQRLFTGDERLGKVSSPDQLIALNNLARPRVVVGGKNKSIVIDVASGSAVGFVDGNHSSLCATVAQKKLVIGGITDGSTPKAKLWRAALGAEAGLQAATPVEPPLPGLTGKLKTIALTQHELPTSDSQEKRPLTLLAAASDKSFAVYNADTLTNALALATDTSNTVLTPSGEILAIRLSPAVEEDCITAAVSLKTTGSEWRVQLYDLPLQLKDDQQTSRPYTSWTSSQFPSIVSKSLAVALTSDGPRVVVNTQALRVSELLRLRAGMSPVYELRIQLLQEQGAFLTGRITPSRRLSLEVALGGKAKSLGLPIDITKLNARAALIQGPYSCFLVDSIDRDKFRLAGLLVLWSDSKHSSDAMRGVLLLEDSHPTRPNDSTPGDFGASATLIIPNAATGKTNVTLQGPRSRIRVMPFDAQSESIDSLISCETLSWLLTGRPAGTKIDTELHLSDLRYYTSKLNSESEQTAIVRAVFSGPNTPQIQGDFVVKVKRSVDIQAVETYTLTLEKTAYAALAAVEPAPVEFGTTRDDVVYPAVPGGSVGRAFDLVEPQFQSASTLNETEKLRLGTVVLDNKELKLLSIKAPASFAYDLNTGAGVTQPLPLQPIDVPQIEHREAHGARIRARWPSSFEMVPAGKTGDAQTLDLEKLWLLAPLAQTPRGVTALTLNLLVRPHGRALDWTQLLTESVLSIHRDGANLFGDAHGTVESPSVRNVLTSTILRSSGATESKTSSLFDDVRVQTHALRAGLSGVLLVRTRDARGRVNFRFVNSPYHSLVPIAAKRLEPSRGAENSIDEEIDPRLISPADVFQMTTHSSPRYYPTHCIRDRSTLRGFEREPMSPTETEDLLAIRIAEMPALRGAETPTRPLVASHSTNSGTPFIPQAFELGFGIDKPGGASHQIVQCVGTTKDGTLHSALPTTYLRREPQRFTPPTRAGLQIDKKTDFKRENGKLKAHVSWTETLGIVPLEKSGFSETDEFKIEKIDQLEEYKIVNPEKCLRWFVRLGETITEIEGELTVPFTSIADKRSVAAFDIFIVTRIKNLGADTDLPDGNTPQPKLTPFVVTINGADVYKSVLATKVFQKVDDASHGDFEIWRLTRVDDQPAAIPTLLKMLETKDTRLNLVWWKNDEEIGKDVYKKVPKLLDHGKELKLRDVPYQPQFPRLIAVLRSLVNSGPGILSVNRESTLFDGPAASSNGVVAQLRGTNSDHPWIRFDAVDAETMSLSDPLTVDGDAELHLVKVYDDGATLATHQAIKMKS